MGYDSSGTKIPIGFHPKTRMGLKTMRNLVDWLGKTAGIGGLKITHSSGRRTITSILSAWNQKSKQLISKGTKHKLRDN